MLILHNYFYHFIKYIYSYYRCYNTNFYKL